MYIYIYVYIYTHTHRSQYMFTYLTYSYKVYTYKHRYVYLFCKYLCIRKLLYCTFEISEKKYFLGIYFDIPEITPLAVGVYRFNADDVEVRII